MIEGRGSAGRSISELVAGLNDGQHLALDAVVAFVDGELEPGAHGRAAAHLGRCVTCTAEVNAQRQMRVAVQSAAGPVVPDSLLAALRSIPETAVLPPPPDSMAVDPDGAIVSCAPGQDGAAARAARSRHGKQAAGTVFSGMVLGALILATAGGAQSEISEPREAASDPAPVAATSDGLRAVQTGTWSGTVPQSSIGVVHGGWAVGLR